jgi:hypothetical protein
MKCYCLISELIKRRQLNSWLIQIDSLISGVTFLFLVFDSVVNKDPTNL